MKVLNTRRIGLVILLCCVALCSFAQVKAIRTVIVEKTVKIAKRGWDVYANPDMSNVVGTVNPGDSVTVYGWKPWTYMIESNSGVGYISWRALRVTPALQKMATELESKSDSLQKVGPMIDSLNRYKSLQYWKPVLDSGALSDSTVVIEDATIPPDQLSFLRLYAADTDIQAGECTAVTLSFYVSDQNTVPLQFFDLSNQLLPIINETLAQSDAWSANAEIDNVVAKAVEIKGKGFDEYRLYSAMYCPVYAKPIEFKSITLKLMKIDRQAGTETPLPFTTKPLKINVRAADNASATKADFFQLTGRFQVSDKIVTAPGSSMLYTLTVKGKGYTFPLQTPALTGENFQAEIMSVKHADTILNNTYYSSKTFTWKLYLKEGKYSLWSKPVFSYYDPESKSVKTLNSTRQINVAAGKGNYRVIPAKPSPDHFILMDVSHSMLIEDYEPTRLEVVKKGVRDFLVKRVTCDVGLIAFSGNASQIDIAGSGKCYSGSQIQKVGFSFTEKSRGTAMGDAVWLAVHSGDSETPVRKIVLISDGENTSGYTNFSQAIALAKKYKIIVHSIGIGKSGDVPFGKNPDGVRLMIPSNFTDTMLKQIAAQTGGKYLHVESAAEINSFLAEILAE